MYTCRIIKVAVTLRCRLVTWPAADEMCPPPVAWSPPKNYTLFIIFYHLTGSGASQISPEMLLCHAEENIKNAERRTPAHDRICVLFVQSPSSSPLPAPTGAPTVVVESGPVVYDDAGADEEDEEEEETCLSAMDLLGTDGLLKHTLSVNSALLRVSNAQIEHHFPAFRWPRVTFYRQQQN